MSSLTPPVPEGGGATGARKALDLAELRRRVGDRKGPDLWRSLEEMARLPELEELVRREFPEQAATWSDGVSRRRFLQLMSASLAFGGLAACTRQPLEKIVPYVHQPEQIVPGRPLWFATGMALDGYARSLLVESHMGRPTKVEGNPEHPASLGSSDLLSQASILELYDPDRSQTPTQLGRIRSWTAFIDDLTRGLRALDALGGARLRILTETVTSPAMAALLQQVLAAHPQARWHQYGAVTRDGEREGAQRAFGEPASVRYDFSQAAIVVSLDADFLASGPGSVRYARDFSARHRPVEGGPPMSRLYALEATPSPTGTVADHRLSLSSAEIGHFAADLAGVLGVAGIPPSDSDRWKGLVGAVATDLQRHQGAGAIVPGDYMPAPVHTLALAINDALGNLGSSVHCTEPVESAPVAQLESLAELTRAMDAGEVDVLLILGGNPVYDAPADLDFAAAMQKVPRRIRLGSYEDETSAYCQWHLPEAHYLESWSDHRAFDGTVTLGQPLVEPLYGGRSALEVLSIFTAAGARPGDELVREHWRSDWQPGDAQGGAEQEATGPSGEGSAPSGDFARAWRRALHDGFLPATAAAERSLTVRRGAARQAAVELRAIAPPSGKRPELLLRPDPTVWDGRFANNGWLQECPKPLTKLTWDNAALVSPALAQHLGVANEQVVELSVDGRALEVPVWIHPGQPESSIALSLGYGRRRTGRVGSGTGVDAYPLRTSRAPWRARDVEVRPTADRYPLASTQLHNNIPQEGEQAEKRHLVRSATLEEFRRDPEFAHHVGHGIDESLSLYPGHEYEGAAWGMSIDLGACTGCNACVVACQSENNIPVVGKEQVLLGREMHWIRIDRYYEGSLDAPRTHNQPVLCMHCEQAPCEVVCPVAATVHTHEGLNDMVYNRCVGTRYCANNCPYKVRRFNFLKYNDDETPVLELLRNPDVTVRVRGVMEKCSYCVQRISAARIRARREDRRVRDGEVVTACQQSCPTRAIVFGDVNDPESEVAKGKSDPRDYGILTELGTRPRTTYLAKVRNPNPDLTPEAAGGEGHHA